MRQGSQTGLVGPAHSPAGSAATSAPSLACCSALSGAGPSGSVIAHWLLGHVGGFSQPRWIAPDTTTPPAAAGTASARTTCPRPIQKPSAPPRSRVTVVGGHGTP